MENTNNIPTAYEGKEPYIFVSYAHKDNEKVLPILSRLVENGYRVWYDAGIEAGEDWPESVATHLAKAEAVLFFLSKNAIASQNCAREIHFAISKQKPALTIYLEDVALTLGMEMQLGVIQAIFRNRMDSDAFYNSLFGVKCLQHCFSPETKRGDQFGSEFCTKDFVIENGILKKYLGSKRIVTIPSSVIEIDLGVFDSSNICHVYIPNSVKKLAPFAFGNCKELTSIYIPDSVECINEYAFYGCTKLKKINLGKNAKFVIERKPWDGQGSPFLHCPSIEEIYVHYQNPYYRSQNNCIVQIDDGSLVLGCKTSLVSTTIIRKNAFRGSTQMEKIEIPEGVTKIEDGAFSDCESLKDIYIPRSVYDIGFRAFAGCTSLKTIVLPHTLSYVAEEAFAGCNNATIYCEPTQKPLVWGENWYFSPHCIPYSKPPLEIYWGGEWEYDANRVPHPHAFLNSDIHLIPMDELMGMRLKDLFLPPIALNPLGRYGVKTLGELCAMNEEELIKVRSLGQRGWATIIAFMNKLGVAFSTKKEPKIFSMTIEELDFPVRIYNCLKRAGINTVGDLTEETFEDILKIKNLGRQHLQPIVDKLHSLGLALKSDE